MDVSLSQSWAGEVHNVGLRHDFPHKLARHVEMLAERVDLAIRGSIVFKSPVHEDEGITLTPFPLLTVSLPEAVCWVWASPPPTRFDANKNTENITQCKAKLSLCGYSLPSMK